MFDLVSLIKTVGYLGIGFMVFAESGLFIGFFLPGDSLLFTAGFLASQDMLSLSILLPLSLVCAILGDSVGYAFGKRIGPKIFTREDSLLFHRDHVVRAQHFYDRYGGKAIVLARFMPVVRTFAPIVAGVGTMRYSRFLIFNVVGGVLWGLGLPLAGYFLGATIPNVDRYLLPIIALIIIASAAPVAKHILSDPAARAAITRFVRERVLKRPPHA